MVSRGRFRCLLSVLPQIQWEAIKALVEAVPVIVAPHPVLTTPFSGGGEVFVTSENAFAIPDSGPSFDNTRSAVQVCIRIWLGVFRFRNRKI